jgi:cytochrome b561
MQVADTRAGYGWLSIASHWLIAIAVLVMWLIAQKFEALPRGAERAMAMGWHISIGAVVAPLLLARAGARIARGWPAPMPQPRALELLSQAVHWGLLAATATLAISGPMAVFSGGRAISVFGLFEIPSPMVRNHDVHEVFETVHGLAVNVLIVLVIVHVLGAAKHVIVDRDRTLLRMIRPERPDN